MDYLTDLLASRRRRVALETGTFPLEALDKINPHLDRADRARLRGVSRHIRDALDSNLPAALEEFKRFTPGTTPPKKELLTLPKSALLRSFFGELCDVDFMRAGLGLLASFSVGVTVGRSQASPVCALLCGIEAALISTYVCIARTDLATRRDAPARHVAATEQKVAALNGLPEAPAERAHLLDDLQHATRLRLQRAHQALGLLPALIEENRFREALAFVKALPSDMHLPEPLLMAAMGHCLAASRHGNDAYRTAGFELATHLETRGDLRSRSDTTMLALQNIGLKSLNDVAYFRRAPYIEHCLRLCQGKWPPLTQLREVSFWMDVILAQVNDKADFPLLVSLAEMFVDRALRTGLDYCRSTFQAMIRLRVFSREDLLRRGENLARQTNDGRTPEERQAAAIVLGQIPGL